MSDSLIYFRDGELIAEHNTARVYKMEGELFLELGPPGTHSLWALESELDDYMHQLGDLPRGQCLEVGLGLGVASRYILTFPQVEHLTTVEINEDVVAVHDKIDESHRGRQLDYDRSKHRILNTDGLEYAYRTSRLYDFIFIDCYDVIDEDTIPLIADMINANSRILKPNGAMIGWLDKHTPEPYASAFMELFQQI